MRAEIRFVPGQRGLFHVHPLANLLILLSFLGVALASDSLLLRAGGVAAVLGLAAWSDASPRSFFRSLRFVGVFALLLFFAQVLSVREGRVLFRVLIPITDLGVVAGAGMSLRFLLILTSSYLFVSVTDPDRLAHVLMRWGIPYRYGYAFILALRFVPFFRHELQTVREAQQMRGVRTSIRRPGGLRRAIRYTFVPVLVSGLMRVDSIAMSMKGRAFGRHPRRTMAPLLRWTAWDLFAVAWSLVWIGATIGSIRGGWL